MVQLIVKRIVNHSVDIGMSGSADCLEIFFGAREIFV
jgi:hypothetical protein